MTKRLFLLLSLLMLSLPTLHAEEAEEGAEKEGPKKAQYIAIGVEEGEGANNRIVVNIKEGTRNRYMQIKVQAMSREESVLEAIEANQPALLHAMIMLFAHQDGTMMRDIQKREEVRGQALTELQKVLSEVAGINEGLEAVYFTDFVIQ